MTSTFLGKRNININIRFVTQNQVPQKKCLHVSKKEKKRKKS